MTVDEPSALVVANAAWHISTGAREVHIYFDRPKDPVMRIVKKMPQVIAVECNDEYWKWIQKRRPHAQTRRQYANANDAQRRCSVDWLAHIDADELLLQISPIQWELKSIQKMSVALHFVVRERIYRDNSTSYSIFDGAFRSRSHMPAALDEVIFGELNRYLQRGLLSHCSGKTAVPTNQDFLLGVHSAYRGTRSKENRAKTLPSKSTVLLHFDGMTPLHWMARMVRYAKMTQQLGTSMFSKSRQYQIAECLESIGSRPSALAFHNKLSFLNHEQLLRHISYDLLHTGRFDPTEAILSVTSKLTDLSPKAFEVDFLDRELDVPASIGLYPASCSLRTSLERNIDTTTQHITAAST